MWKEEVSSPSAFFLDYRRAAPNFVVDVRFAVKFLRRQLGSFTLFFFKYGIKISFIIVQKNLLQILVFHRQKL